MIGSTLFCRPHKRNDTGVSADSPNFHLCSNRKAYLMSDYSLLNISRDGQIATIELIRIEKHLREQRQKGRPGGAQRAAEVGRALNELRHDDTVRVIVITGRDDVHNSALKLRPSRQSR